MAVKGSKYRKTEETFLSQCENGEGSGMEMLLRNMKVRSRIKSVALYVCLDGTAGDPWVGLSNEFVQKSHIL